MVATTNEAVCSSLRKHVWTAQWPETCKFINQKAENDFGNTHATGSRRLSTIEGGMDHLKVHPRFLNSNATSHKWAPRVLDEHTKKVNYLDKSVKENTCATYPIEYIPKGKIPCVGRHPKNVILLAFDAFGVLPSSMAIQLRYTLMDWKPKRFIAFNNFSRVYKVKVFPGTYNS
ncbi:phosphoenolpyruvate carboxykinase [Artemisia annua]|uniref:Phosphoenolpyruvate carboxykinase n=1 Tax=Artemisia annua TaxID=35608 RepID=A0A2U1MXJ5_ARTAN|nr:phosphoenolpyruvate carboxykinase [Artemisia annua]